MIDLLKDIEGAAEAGLDIRAKLIIGLGAALAITGAAIFGANYFENKGRELERAGWLAKQVAEQQADAALVRKHESDMAALQAQHEAIERKTSEDHENELAQLRRERDADRAAVDRAGGLRIPAPACASGGAVAGTETAGASRRDEAGAGTIRLPEQVENDLWSLADDADEVSAQLRACQAWIRDNGFYGPAEHESGELHGKLSDEQTSSEAAP